jgi:Zn-dependent metalloprotease
MALHLEGRVVTAPGGPAWVVHSAGNDTALPGRAVRRAGEAESGDVAVDEAAAGITGVLALFEEVYDRVSYDGRGSRVDVTVHYGRDYPNAFWDGTQLVFGDGDGRVFERFTKPVDVVGHEFAHAVTEHSAGLVYRDQPGALNESVSDVFASCLKQRLLGQSAADADWLIGAGIFRPGVAARGLRDMAAPGTAYDDPVLGQDPQGGHLDGYDDSGDVHVNSGIPNRAVHLAATAIGGSSWDGAGRIWYAALTGGDVGPETDFAGFAAATVAAAGAHVAAVRRAWAAVGVVDPARRVSVGRTGGFGGLRAEGALDLDAGDRRAGEVTDLIGRVDLAAVPTGDPQPDRCVYDFDLCGDCATVPEQHLTPDLARLAEVLLSGTP